MRRFGVDVIGTLDQLEVSLASKEIFRQLIRSSCSAGSNYRACRRARSTADMIAKLKIVEEELDESLHWLEVLAEARLAPKTILKSLHIEGTELLSITVAKIKALRKKPQKGSVSRK